MDKGEFDQARICVEKSKKEKANHVQAELKSIKNEHKKKRENLLDKQVKEMKQICSNFEKLLSDNKIDFEKEIEGYNKQMNSLVLNLLSQNINEAQDRLVLKDKRKDINLCLTSFLRKLLEERNYPQFIPKF